MLENGKSRSKKITLPAVQEEDGARRRMDEMLIKGFERRFDFLGEQTSELMRTLRGFNGTPGVMERIARIETVMLNQGQMLAEIHGLLITLTPEKKKPDEDEHLTTGRLATLAWGFAKPILTAVVIWVLLTFFPNVIVLLGKP